MRAYFMSESIAMAFIVKVEALGHCGYVEALPKGYKVVWSP